VTITKNERHLINRVSINSNNLVIPLLIERVYHPGYAEKLIFELFPPDVPQKNQTSKPIFSNERRPENQ